MRKLNLLKTGKGQELRPGDQVAYVMEPAIRAHTMLGEITVAFTPGHLRVARIVEIVEVCPGFAEFDGEYRLRLDTEVEVNSDDVCRTDQSFKYAPCQ